MPLTSIPVYATGDTIEASWANDLRDNFLLLDSRTGGDPGAAGKVNVSTSSTAGSPQVMAESNQLTSAKVNKTNPVVATFAAAAAELSAFVQVTDAGGIADAPIPGSIDWYLIQSRYPNVGINYRWQMAAQITDPNEVYHRLVQAGVGGTWRRLLHPANIGLQEIVMTGGAGITFGGSSTPGRIYDVNTTTTVIRGHANRVGVYNNALTQLMLDIQASAVAVLGQIQAASAAIAGGATLGGNTTNAGTVDVGGNSTFAGTLGIGGLLSAAAAAISGNGAVAGTWGVGGALTVGGTLGVTGVISGPGTVPLGAVVWFETAAELTAAGASWQRYTAADGRFLIGASAGIFGQAFTEATNYGANWTPAVGVSATNGTLGVNAGTLAASSSAIAGTGTPAGTFAGGAGAAALQTHTHPAPTISLSGSPALSGSVGIAGTTTTWLLPSRAGVWGRRI